MDEQDKIEEEVSNLFDQADNQLFKQRNYDEARQIYDKILELQPTNVDAINSLAYCVKYMAASGPEQLNETLFTDLE
jgi:tetratricopeptide (TPR) repeat protein